MNWIKNYLERRRLRRITRLGRKLAILTRKDKADAMLLFIKTGHGIAVIMAGENEGVTYALAKGLNANPQIEPLIHLALGANEYANFINNPKPAASTKPTGN